ncbi:hypothetical protein EGW08_016628 [Elysia chlorotica]|uniref:RNA ligase 1 n=1 Tax=Elysia chlorotica TaxID=188477 RepID=A0A433T244_ELYCH|nr:hypothetical protein EGW08_016628 [Elysia chlorotica]
MNPVQQKISCVYIVGVTDESSEKRKHQTYKVTATRCLHPKTEDDDIASAIATEKLDGTCCLIKLFEGQPWLWARHDRKPSKAGERKFAQHKKNLKDKEVSKFSWNPEKDFKEVPANWIPASRLEVVDGVVMPDKLGHTPGWVPVELTSRQHCWHLSAVNMEEGMALVLRESQDHTGELVLKSEPLSDLIGQTCELVGSNINGNPYGLGTKKHPIHFLVPHGCLPVDCPPPHDQDALVTWLRGDDDDDDDDGDDDDDDDGDGESGGSAVEGIVWHCPNGELYKVHRHHLALTWPVSEPRLSRRPVRVKVELTGSKAVCETRSDRDGGTQHSDLFTALHSLNGQVFDSLRHLHKNLFPEIVKVEDR